MYFYKENIDEKEETRQIMYYQNNDIILTNYKYIKKTNNKIKKMVVNDKYENIKDEKNKLNYYTTNLKNIANI